MAEWLKSDTEQLFGSRRQLFEEHWQSLSLSGIFSVSDKWEYPWVSVNVLSVYYTLSYFVTGF